MLQASCLKYLKITINFFCCLEITLLNNSSQINKLSVNIFYLIFGALFLKKTVHFQIATSKLYFQPKKLNFLNLHYITMTHKILYVFQTLNINKTCVGVKLYAVYTFCQSLQQTKNNKAKKGFCSIDLNDFQEKICKVFLNYSVHCCS